MLKPLTSAALALILSACGAVAPPAPTRTPIPPTVTIEARATLQTSSTPTLSKAPTPERDRIAATLDVGGIPSQLTFADGLVWVLLGSGTIVRLDPKTNQITGKPIPAGRSAGDLAHGEGALWVTAVQDGDLGAPSDNDGVSRIDPRTGEIVATIKLPRGPMSVVATPGSIWVVQFGLDGDTVTRIDSRTNQIAGKPMQTGRAPLHLAVGEGSVWVANHDAHTITRIDLKTNQVVANIRVPSEPHRVAVGEGSVWVSNWHDSSVTRIDPMTNQVVGEPIPIGFTAGAIAAGLGSVWVTSDYRVDGKPESTVLVRVDVKTLRAVETIPLGGHPTAVVVAEGAVWVARARPDGLLRIQP